MFKLAQLRLDGNLEAGVQAHLAIQEMDMTAAGAARPVTASSTTARLPAAAHLRALLDDWRTAFRAQVPRPDSRRGMSREAPLLFDPAGLQDTTQRLVTDFERWLDAESFRPIRDRWLEMLGRGKVEIQIRTANPILHALPWPQWSLIGANPSAGIAFATPDVDARTTPAGPRLHGPVKLLALFGDSRGIDVQADQALLDALRDANATPKFLLSPSRQTLNDHLWEGDWDLLFFAGHSATQGDEGRLFINADESLTTADLEYALQRALDRGLQVAIFNSCDGLGLAAALQALHVPHTIVMREPVPDAVAQAFLRYFLDHLLSGHSLSLAVRRARERLQGLEGRYPGASWLPLVFQADDAMAVTWSDLGYRPSTDCPFQGLSTFSEAAAPYFFGRELFTATLREAVETEDVVGIVGASGSGKSSIVFAGLIPVLRRAGWRILAMRPGRKPGGVFQDLWPSAAHPATPPSRKRALIYIDQFEEIYTQGATEPEQHAFVDRLLHCVETDGVSLLITLRADFLPAALSYPPLASALQHAMHLLGAMGLEDLRAAIERPAEVFGVRVEPGLTDVLLAACTRGGANLCVLEFVLTALWQRMEERTLTHGDYQAIGGLEQAIARHAEQIHAALNLSEQQRARRVLLQTVSPADNETYVRRTASREEIGESDWSVVAKLATARLLVTSGDTEAGSQNIELIHEAIIEEWPHLRQWAMEQRAFRQWQDDVRKAAKAWREQRRDKGFLLRGKALAASEEWVQRYPEQVTEETDFVNASVRLRQRAVGALTVGLVIALLVAGAADLGWWRVARYAADQQIQLLVSQAERAFERSHRGRAREPYTRDAQYEQEDQQYQTSILRAIEAGTAFLRWPGLPVRTQLLVTSALRQIGREDSGIEEVHYPDCQHLQRGPIAMVANADLDIAACVHYDGAVRVFNRRTGELRATFPGEISWVDDVAFSPDNKSIVAGTLTGDLNIWDRRNGVLLRSLGGGKSQISLVSTSANGGLIAAAAYDGSVSIWNTTGSTVRQTLAAYSKETGRRAVEVQSLQFDRTNRFLVTNNAFGAIKVWEWQPARLVTELRAPNHDKLPAETVRYLGLTPDDHYIIYSQEGEYGKPQTVVFQKLDMGADQRTISLPPGRVFIDADAKILALIDANIIPADRIDALANHARQIVSLWDARNGRKLREISIPGVASEISFSPDGKQLSIYTYEHDRNRLGPDHTKPAQVTLWTTEGRQIARSEQLGEVLSMEYSPDGRTLAVSSFGNSTAKGHQIVVKLWDTSAGTLVKTLIEEGITGGSEGISVGARLRFSPDGATLAVVLGHGIVELFDVVTGAKLTLPNLNDAKDVPATSAQCGQGAACIRRNTRGSVAKMTEQGPESIRFLRFDWTLTPAANIDQAARTITTVNWYGKLQERSLDTGAILKNRSLAFDALASRIAFTPNGRMIASAMSDGSIRLWDVASGREHLRLKDDKNLMRSSWMKRSIRFSPDATKLATLDSGADHSRAVSRLDAWDLSAGSRIALPEEAIDVAFSPDGQEAAVVTDENRIQLWDLSRTKEIATLQPAAQHIERLWYSHDGRYIYVICLNEIIFIHRTSRSEMGRLGVSMTNPSALSIDLDKQEVIAQDGVTGRYVNIDIRKLIVENCNSIRQRLETTPNLSAEDRHICDGF